MRSFELPWKGFLIQDMLLETQDRRNGKEQENISYAQARRNNAEAHFQKCTSGVIEESGCNTYWKPLTIGRPDQFVLLDESREDDRAYNLYKI
jgi:hypothetical protein